MLLTMSIDGTVTRASNEPIYQGSVDVNKIILLAPYATGTVITVHFKLPNGQYVYPYFASPTESPIAMTELDAFPGYFDADGKRYNAWVLNVDYPLTQISGDLEIQFNAVLSNGYQTSSITMNTVARGLPYLPPSIDNEAYATIISAIEAAQAAQEIAQNSEASAGRYAELANEAKGYAETYANESYEHEQAAAQSVVEAQAVADRLADLMESFNTNVGNLEGVLDEIIALQDYYTGATFDELHEYAMNVAEGGTQ